MMNIIICGAGQVGFNLAQYLSENNYNVTVIDHNPDLIHHINERLEVRAICGHACYPNVLKQANIKDAHMLIAVTEQDEVNMVACQVAYALCQEPLRIARIRHQAYLHPLDHDSFLKNHLNIDHIISPEIELGKSISRSLRVPGAFQVIPLAGGLIKMIGVRCTALTSLINTPISYLNALVTDLDINIIAIVRDMKSFIPSPKDIILKDDMLYFVVDREKIDKTMMAFGHKTKDQRHIVIVGGGNVGLRLIQEIEEKHNFKLHVIEKNPRRAQEIAEKVSNTLVICGDSLDTDILCEAGVPSAETVVAVTQDDRVNILSALLAKKQGSNRALILLNNSAYTPLLSSLGIDGAIDPRSVTISRILYHIRQSHVKSVVSVANGLGQLIEFEVSTASDLIGTLPQTHMMKDLLIVAIVRQGKVHITLDQLIIEAGDRMIIMAHKKALPKVEKIFATSQNLF